MSHITIMFNKHGEPPLVVYPDFPAARKSMVRWEIAATKESKIHGVLIEFEKDDAKYFKDSNNDLSNRVYKSFENGKKIRGWVPEDRPLGVDKYTITGVDECGCHVELDPTIIVTDP